jgi:hypothetical protein
LVVGGWFCAVDAEDVAGAKGAAGVPAEEAEGEGGFAAEVVGDVEAVADGEVGAEARAIDGAEAEGLTGFDAEGAVVGDGFVVEGGGHLRAGECDDGGGVEAERRALDGALESGGGVGVADEAVGEAEGQVVHRAGGRNTDIPIAEATGEILHGGLGAAFENVDRRSDVGERGEVFGGDPTGAETGRGGDLAEVVEICLQTVDTRVGQGGVEAGEGVGAVGAADDDFREERIVEGGDLGAAFDPGFNAGVSRRGRRMGGRRAVWDLATFVSFARLFSVPIVSRR